MMPAWVELDYDTALLDHKLSFPLLRLLVRKGDKKAYKVYKEEIAKRFQSDYLAVPLYLIIEGFLENLSPEEYGRISLRYNLKLKNSIKLALKSYDNKELFGMAIDILRNLSFSYHDKHALRILKALVNKMMIFSPDNVSHFLDYNFPNEFLASDLYYFIMHSPVFLDLLTVDSNIIALFKETSNNLKGKRLNAMLNEILFIINCREDKSNIHKYTLECLKEYKIISDRIRLKQLKE